MQDETIYKLVTMLGDARIAETELRRDNAILRDQFYAFSKANDDLMRRVADMEKEIEKWKGVVNSTATRNLNLSAEIREKDAKIAEYEIILKPIRPEDEDRLAPWEPIPDNVQRIACGTFSGSVYFSTDKDGRIVKVESQGNSITMDLRDMRICCRRGMWSPF